MLRFPVIYAHQITLGNHAGMISIMLIHLLEALTLVLVALAAYRGHHYYQAAMHGELPCPPPMEKETLPATSDLPKNTHKSPSAPEQPPNSVPLRSETLIGPEINNTPLAKSDAPSKTNSKQSALDNYIGDFF